MLQTIEAKLKEVMEPVYYGSADAVDNSALWRYIVFFRDKTSRGTNNKGYSDYYTVGIVDENYVSVDDVEKVVEKMESIFGMRMASTDIDFNYTRKPGTNAVVEVASLSFVHARKKV